MRYYRAISVLCLALVGTTIAAAQSAPPSPVQQAADSLNKQAQALYLQKNYFDAIKLYTASAQMGSADAEYYLGLIYLYGQGVPKDTAQARSWLRKAADHGSLDAKTALAKLTGQPAPAAKAVASPKPFTTAQEPADLCKLPIADLEKRVDAGQAAAESCLGERYLRGKDVTRDLNQALAWFQKAAANGDARGEEELGYMYLYGIGMAHKDPAQAMTWYQKAAAQGNADAELSIGGMYMWGESVPKDPAQAMSWYQKAAAHGNAEAQSAIGEMYEEGNGVPRDYAQALSWFQKGAAQGGVSAEYNLGKMYQDGLGVQQDYTQAMAWYQKIVARPEIGFPDVEARIGDLYHMGWGVTRDDAQALSWYQKAANHGSPGAQSMLGLMYENGWGTAKDIDQARSWYQKAAARGNTGAKDALARIDAASKPPADLTTLDNSALEQWANSGDARAQVEMGLRYLGGHLSLYFTKKIGENPVEASQADNPSFEPWSDDPNPGHWLGSNLSTDQIIDKQFFWYRKAAAQGYAPGIERLGYTYIAGTKPDYAQALSLFQKAADLGLSTADIDLGALYVSGLGVPKDVAKGMTYIQQAAAQGDTFAMYLLSQAYFYGSGEDQNATLALSLARKAALQHEGNALRDLPAMEAKGHPVPVTDLPFLDKATLEAQAESGYAAAQDEIGDRYVTGWHCDQFHICDIDKDFEMAANWYEQAADQGDAGAKKKLAQLKAGRVPQIADKTGAQSGDAGSGESQAANLTQRINDLESSAQTDELAAAAADLQASQQSGLIAWGEQKIAGKFRSNAANERAQADQLRSQLVALQGSDSGTNPNRHSIIAAGVEGLGTAAQTQNVDPNASVSNMAGNATEGALNYMANGTPTVITAALNSGDTSPGSSTAVCAHDPTYTANMNELRANPESQAPAYRAAAALCQCYINADPTNPNRSQWQQCVDQNTQSAQQLDSNSPTVGGVTPTGNTLRPTNGNGQVPNNCQPGMIGCAGVAQ